jgi:hypothetical protein
MGIVAIDNLSFALARMENLQPLETFVKALPTCSRQKKIQTSRRSLPTKCRQDIVLQGFLQH